MIGSLRGKLTEKRPNKVLLDVAGVGYEVQIPLSTFTSLGSLHEEATLLIHMHVREDQLALYGFLTAREKQCFELLISASGVGPSLALKILSGMGLEQLIPAIRKGDLVQLVRIPGVGRKTAERIVVELRDKIEIAEEEAVKVGRGSESEAEAQVTSVVANLGYEPRMIQGAIEKLGAKASTNFDTLLHDVLQELGGRVMHKRQRASTGKV